MSLRFRTVSEIGPLPPVEWVWENRIARGYPTQLGGTGGVGKSQFIASLEVAVASGLPFLGGYTCQGRVIHVDFDTDARAQVPWLKRAAVGQGLAENSKEIEDLISYVDEELGGHLDLAGLEKLRAHALQIGAVLIVIDAFTSAFPHIRGNDAGEVMQVMAAFQRLAKDTNAAVVTLDHTPKPSANSPEGRGLLGSTIKAAGARAVHLLTRVKPKEVGGLDVLKLEAHKNNLAPVGEPMGIQRVWEGDGLRFEPYALPDDEHDAPSLKARKVLESYLNDRAGSTVPRKELIDYLIVRLNVSERTVKRALGEAITDGAVLVVSLGGRGNPVAYKSALEPADPGPLDVLAQNQLDVSDGTLSGTVLGPKPGFGPKNHDLTQDSVPLPTTPQAAPLTSAAGWEGDPL